METSPKLREHLDSLKQAALTILQVQAALLPYIEEIDAVKRLAPDLEIMQSEPLKRPEAQEHEA